MDDGSIDVSSQSVRPSPYSSMATPRHRKTENLKVSFNDDVNTIFISDKYPGERSVGDLKSTIKQAKEQLRADWLKSDGSATMPCLDKRPMHILVHIERTQRTMAESEEWEKIVERSEKAARVRAIQLHFHVHSNLSYALPLSQSMQDEKPATSIPAALLALSKAEHGRTWLYDTGAHAPCIGWKHLTPEERKRAFTVEAKGFITAAGTHWAHQAVQCYVPFLG